MKHLSIFIVFLLIIGCVSRGPLVSKDKMGNLEINVVTSDSNTNVDYCDVYIDGLFVGNISSERPVLQVSEGSHEIKITLEGYQQYTRTIEIAGYPNHQVLNVRLVK